MATETPLNHPGEAAQNERYFRFRATVLGISATGTPSAISGLSSLKAAYEPAEGAEPGTLEAEAPSVDKVLILGWYPGIKAQQGLMLLWPDGVTKRRFIIDDAVPGDSGPTRTLLTVTPGR